MPETTPTTNDRKRKREGNLSVSTSGFIPPTDEELKHLPPSPGEWVHMQKQQSELKNPFHSDGEDDNDPKSPKSPDYSPFAEYDPINDQKILFQGFSCVGQNDHSEQKSEKQDDSELELKWVQYVAKFMLPDIKKDEHMIPEEVMRAFEYFEEMLDDKGECFKVREKFEEFWEAFVCYLDREENYDTSKMDEKKELKQEIKKIFKILATRYDDEKRCEKLGIFLRSFDALNDDEDDDGEKTEFSKKNLLNHFRLDERMYGDVREKHVKKLFKKLSKVKNG